MLIFTDNWSTACALESGRVDDPVIRGALREIWLWAAVGDVDVVVRHMPGECMGVVDALNRQGFDQRARSKVEVFTTRAVGKRVGVPDDMLRPPITM